MRGAIFLEGVHYYVHYFWGYCTLSGRGALFLESINFVRCALFLEGVHYFLECLIFGRALFLGGVHYFWKGCITFGGDCTILGRDTLFLEGVHYFCVYYYF